MRLPLRVGQMASAGQRRGGGRGSVTDEVVGADQHQCPPSLHAALLPAHSKLLSLGVGHDEPGPPCQLWGEAGSEREVSPTVPPGLPGAGSSVFPDLGRWVLSL